jgi:peptide chain release factor 1
LLAAYLRYAHEQKLETDLVYNSDSAWSVQITGKSCWECFSGEAGKHIVQRVPPTESKGRRHTSTVSVAVMQLLQVVDSSRPLPSAEVEIITQRGHGKGGQNVNKIESAVRAIHKPTGISVFINGRDQYRNKQIALEILQSRIIERERELIHNEHNRQKAAQLGYGTRSGKLRTYNFINSYVLDHQTGKRTHRIEDVMKGRFDLLK